MQINTLYILVGRQQLGGLSEQSLVAAAKKANLRSELLVVDDIMLDDIPHMKFDGHNLLYQVRVGDGASTIEGALMTFHGDHFTNIYVPTIQIGTPKRYAETLRQMAAGLPVIPTSFIDKNWSSMGDKQLLAKVTALGGFPILYKTLGLAHGQGVRLVSSLDELKPCIAQTNELAEQALLREYLPEYRHYRIVVVDGRPVAAIEYHKPADDFRTNAVDTPNVTAVTMRDLDPAILDIAVCSVEQYMSIIGGVDILVDTIRGVPYLAEVNVPCNFSRAEGPTGVHIGDLIVQALLRKAAAAAV